MPLALVRGMSPRAGLFSFLCVVACGNPEEQSGEPLPPATGSSTAAPDGGDSSDGEEDGGDTDDDDDTDDDTGTTTSSGGTTSDAGSSSTGPAFEDVPVTISFDEFESGVDITDQYGDFVVFSSIRGSTNRTRASGAIASSEPRFICTTSSLCREDTYLDFTHPVSNISFAIVGQCSGTFKARIYVDGVEHATLPMQASGCDGPEIFELPEYENVTRLELVEIDDGSGVGWDDFSFVAHVPL